MKKTETALGRFIKRENETLDIDTIPLTLPGLPGELDGFRITVLADLHMPGPMPYHETIVEAVRGTAPGLLLIAGDSIDEHTRVVDALEPFFTALSAIAPAVAVLGNNDCDADQTPRLRAMYRRAGVTLLEDETRTLAVNGSYLRITGLTDPVAERQGVHSRREGGEPGHMPIDEALAPERRESSRIPAILLLHKPHLARGYTVAKPSVIVCGHAHGGQFRVPGIGGLYAPGQGIFPRLTSGLYDLDGVNLLVSRGLGLHDFPLRLHNRPHLPVLILRGD